MFTLGLSGDTMLGRKVAERLERDPPAALFAEDLVTVAHEADLLVVNLECCISERGERWPDPAKPFFFRAPPRALDALALLGVGAVTLANNHALDYDVAALLDTLDLLDDAGIACVGAGQDLERARAPAELDVAGTRIAVVGLTDHPEDFAAGPSRPGVAHADLRSEVPEWVAATVGAVDADVVLVTPHWGPNMTAEPVSHVRRAAPAVVAAGATLVAGHSAHVFHGVRTLDRDGAPVPVLYDLGDFIDDYAVDPRLRNDHGLFWLLRLDGARPVRLEAVPIFLDYCYTRLARREEAAWIRRRFRDACAAMGTEATEEDGRLVVTW
ncbi:MAG TPA: CapA family protein [Nitriliruptorales bacterium]|nr:CapA family protein [Nitriliruptorales bacterium]